MSSMLPNPSASPLGQQVAESLNARERVMVRRLLGNPLEFPAIFVGWLESRNDALYLRRGVRLSGGGPPGPAGPQGPTGPQGPIGNTGPQGAASTVPGPTGSQGPQGDPGATGSQGIQGVAGTPGEKWFTGSGAPAGGTGIIGDWYLDSANGDFYEKTSASVWTLRGNLKGPQGIQGIQGIQGVTGSTGSTGSTGPAGAAGSIWRSGTGAPAGALGVVGDWYENDANGDIYEKTGASTYTLRDNLTGPQGIQGIPGAGAPDATTSAKGSVQLAGDLAGTAASPQIAAGVILDADVNASAAIAESKLSLATDAAAGTGSRRTIGTGALQAMAGNLRGAASGVASLDANSHVLAAQMEYYGTTPPASPNDGDIWIFPADATNGVMWRFRYRAASASAYKWEFVGGPPLAVATGVQESGSSQTFTDTATVLGITIPRAGDYFVMTTASQWVAGAAIAITCPGGAGFTPADSWTWTSSTAQGQVAAQAPLPALTQSGLLKLQYRVSAAVSMTWTNRRMSITPVRVS